jgi:hypothetical protein
MSNLTCIHRLLIITILVLACWSVGGAAEISDEERTLRDFFSQKSQTAKAEDWGRREMPKVCVELGDKAVPIASEVLLNALSNLTSSNAPRAAFVAECLLYVGGREVLQLFRKIYDESKDEAFKEGWRGALCSAMQRTDSSQDVQFLIDSLKGPKYPWISMVPVVAARALAVLKPESARTALEERAKVFEYVVSDEVKFALDRINGRVWKTPQTDSPGLTDLLKIAVFRFGIPNIDEAPRDAQGFPDIRFDAYVTKDGKRALCSVGITCGNVCGYGYDFVLRNENGEWQVVSLFPTWIS